MIKVLPAIIPHTKEQLEEEINKVSKFASLVQVDISDGVFTPYKTWPYNGRDIDYFNKLKNEDSGWPKWESVDIEVHLMVKNPEDVVLDWVHTGVASIVFHIEATQDFQKIVDICRDNEVSVGVAIKPSTDISLLAEVSSHVDFIQCMGNDLLGKHGVEFDQSVLNKIQQLHQLYPERIIAIDIGVNADTAQSLVDAGATKLIAGHDILDADRPEEEFQLLENIESTHAE